MGVRLVKVYKALIRRGWGPPSEISVRSFLSLFFFWHQRHILALLNGPRCSQYKNTKSPISLIIKNPQNGKLMVQGRGPWASPARGTGPGRRDPRYCCCYEVRGQRLSCRATVQLGQGPLLLLGCAQLLHAPDLVQQATDEGLSGFVTVNQLLLDPGSPGIIAFRVQEFIHIDFQLQDLLSWQL